MSNKRDKDTITLGSGKLYMVEFDEALPSVDEICIDANLLGWIKGGASLEYTAETYEEKDDLGMVSKVIITSEEAILKAGLLTWNGETLTKLVDTGRTTIENNRRITKIGGLANAKNKSYAICFFHEDKVTGTLWVIIKGRNQAGFTVTWAVDSGTVIEPEFKALPHDSEGTLIQLIEELNVTKYVKTSDTDVVSGKDYYTRTGSKEPYTYVKVENPTKADISTYYEIDNN